MPGSVVYSKANIKNHSVLSNVQSKDLFLCFIVKSFRFSYIECRACISLRESSFPNSTDLDVFVNA